MTTLWLPLLLSAVVALAYPRERRDAGVLDAKVRTFLERHRAEWRDWNVPEADGRLLHDLVVRNGFTRALEIGTSTGHAAIWIAWGLSKTGGRLTTVELDEGRHIAALANFRQAGLSGHIDARWADAHELVPGLEGPFDFIFSDADKGWYRKYFDALAPKLLPGGCYVTHNVSDRKDTGFGLGEYVDYLKKLEEFATTFDDRGAGIAVSRRKGGT